MAQRFYDKTNIQVAIVSTIGGVIITLMTILHQRSDLKISNEQMQKEITKKTAEIQRLETMLTPFRTIALEKYTGSEPEALLKLASKIQSLEKADLFKTQRITELEIALQKTAKLAEPNKLVLVSNISKKTNKGYLATLFFICTKNEAIGMVAISAELPKSSTERITNIRKTPPKSGSDIIFAAPKEISPDGHKAVYRYKPLTQEVSIDLEVSGPTLATIQGNMGISPFEIDIK